MADLTQRIIEAVELITPHISQISLELFFCTQRPWTLYTGEKFERYLADLTQRIIEAVELITPHMLTNT